MTMIANIPLGQRLKEWRESHGLSVDNVAHQLDLGQITVVRIETGLLPVSPLLSERIETLIGPPPHPITEKERLMVERVVNAVRAGYIVSLIRPVDVTAGQIVLTFGEREE